VKHCAETCAAKQLQLFAKEAALLRLCVIVPGVNWIARAAPLAPNAPRPHFAATVVLCRRLRWPNIVPAKRPVCEMHQRWLGSAPNALSDNECAPPTK